MTETSKPVIVPQDDAARINAAYRSMIEARKGTVRRALELGAMLKEKQEKLRYGLWLPWLRKNCPEISERTAQNCIRLAKEKSKVEAALAGRKSETVADLTLREALALIAVKQSKPDDTASDAYGKAEDKLIEKLQKLSATEVEQQAEITVTRLKEEVAKLKTPLANAA